MNHKHGGLQEPHYSLNEHMKTPRQRRRWPWIVGGIAALVIIASGATFVLYQRNLEPVAAQSTTKLFTVKAGDSATAIASNLQQQGLIRDSLSFRVALRLSGKTASIKAGSYRLSPADSASAIIAKLESGQVDLVQLQISPGTTLDAIKKQFVSAGYRQDAVDAAFKKNYTHPLLADKPAEATLEGYIFPDTYRFDPDSGPEAALTQIFDTFYKKLNDANLLTAAKAENLNSYQLVTLGSIIEKEVSNSADQAHVAQVFLKRLSTGMPLGSDVTFMYAAKLLGVTPTPNLQSPYNTRIVTGLPPGPIANMRLQALQAVAEPTKTDDLYFVAGDDGATYFAKTLPEHEANVAAHCKIGCQ